MQLKSLQKNLPYLIILILLILLSFQRCQKPADSQPQKPQIKVERDTVVVVKKDTIKSKPKLIRSEPDTLFLSDSVMFIPPELLAQLRDYHTKKIYTDSIALDSLGYVRITDTVYKNKLEGHDVQYSVSIPKVTETITITNPAKPVRQIYIGGTLLGNQTMPLRGATANILYKDRKDRVFGVSAGINEGHIIYGVSSYWKISFRK